jgi:hypothetical protein
MLAYLDALVAAVTARDIAEIERLLAHPLARILTRDAIADAQAAATGAPKGAPKGAPLRLLQLRHQTAQLLGEHAGEVRSADEFRQALAPSAARASDRRTPARPQMELPLSA